MESLANIVPMVYTEADDGSFAAFVVAFDAVQAELMASVTELSSVALAQFTPDAFINQVGSAHANPFPFLTDSRLKGKAENLSAIYQKRGTKQGIISACYYLCGVKPVIVSDIEWGWVLGNANRGILGVSTRLANGSAPLFWVKIAHSVSQAKQDEMSIIVDFMKPANFQWHFVYVDGVVPMGALESAIIGNDQLTLQGWAASLLEGAPVAWVDIQLDGESLGYADLDVITARNDVQIIMAAAGSTKDCTKSQFTFAVSLDNIQPGAHSVTAVATQLDGQTAIVGTQNINF